MRQSNGILGSAVTGGTQYLNYGPVPPADPPSHHIFPNGSPSARPALAPPTPAGPLAGPWQRPPAPVMAVEAESEVVSD